jgi:hypothetical protein
MAEIIALSNPTWVSSTVLEFTTGRAIGENEVIESAVIAAGAVEDLAGNPIASSTAETTNNSTRDITTPVVATVSIEDDSEVDSTFVRVTFDEEVDPGSLVFGSISLLVNAVSRDISTPTWASASVLEFATDSPVYVGQTCLLTVAAAAIEDLAGNANDSQSGIAVTNNSTRVPYLTAQEIAQEMVSPGGTTHVFFMGDSRTASISRFLDQNAQQIAWGGARIPMLVSDSLGHDSAASGVTSGDLPTPSQHLAGNINSWCPFESYEVEFTGVAEPGSGLSAVQSRCFYVSSNGPTAANYPSLWANAAGQSAKFRTLYYKHGGSTPTTQPGITANWRVTGNDFGGANSNGAYTYDFSGSGYGEIQTDIQDGWGTYPTASPEITAQPLTATTAGQIVAFVAAWVEVEGGVVVHDWSVGGRSIDGWIDDDVFDSGMFSSLLPLFGERRVLWIDIGQNNPAVNNAATHKTKVLELIARFRAGTPSGSVILTTSYPASGDGATTYYADAHREIAAETPGVLLLDTFAAMPTYTEAAALGYHSDTVHFNDIGRAAWCDCVGHLAALAAGTFEVDDLGLDLFLRISGDDVVITSSPDVDQVNDSSGDGSHLSQATAANKPHILPAWRNGRAALEFDGTDYLSRAAFAAGEITQPYTTWDVYETPNAVVSVLFGGTIAGGSSKRGDIFIYDTGAGDWFTTIYAGAQDFVSSDVAAETPALLEIVWNGSSTRSRYLEQGQAEDSRSGLIAGSQALNEPYWGSQDSGAGGYRGVLAARIGARGAVAPQHRYIMREYLRGFYDIST